MNTRIKIFEASGDTHDMPRYVDVHRLFKRGEQIVVYKQALASAPKSTRELAFTVMASKGLDTGRSGASEGCRRSAHRLASGASFSGQDRQGREKGLLLCRGYLNP